ncbi:MAG: OmpH family outer membrane protein, partial [Candidatus Tenebribacter mawsonii]|nr:OmpH family outer membrane protein [Candidatus Tenebribacter mawsonii]
KMKKIVLTIVLAVILATLVFAESEKIAYIDTEKIMMTSPETQEAQTILLGERQKWEQEIADMDAEIEQLYVDYESKKMILTESGKQEAEAKIMSLSEARQARVQELFGETGAFVQRQNELLAPILNKLKTIIEKVSIENNYSIVFDASAGSILYAKPSLDITDLILNEMEKTVE